MTDGTVTSFDRHSGGGFIQPDDGSNPIFVHIAIVRDAGLETLANGQKVSFDHHSGPYGTARATNIICRS